MMCMFSTYAIKGERESEDEATRYGRMAWEDEHILY